jgi:hypothetical protein
MAPTAVVGNASGAEGGIGTFDHVVQKERAPEQRLPQDVK